jgi:hypothetical protein
MGSIKKGVAEEDDRREMRAAGLNAWNSLASFERMYEASVLMN